MSNEWFQFKQFAIHQDRCAMKVGTDGVLLGAWAEGGAHILDIGTGTGLIALMMAQRFEDAMVEGIDIDKEACCLAQTNADDSPFANRVTVHEVAVQRFEAEKRFDSIVSNPPYFIDSLRNPDAKRSEARHTDTLTYDDLCKAAYRLLSDTGRMSIVIPVDYAKRFVASSSISGFYLCKRHDIKTTSRKSPKRCLLAFSKARPSTLDEQEFTMFDDNGNMTDWYAKLTDKFYL